MPATTTVDVSLGDRSYSIQTGAGLLKELAERVQPFVANRHVLVITDSNVGPHYLDFVCDQLRNVAERVDTLTVDAGESSKSVRVCDSLWQQMIGMHCDRKTIVVALGGGVVGDLAGFVAASFTRGLSFIQIPTSLLAQVDSSVGGKVGINLPQAKNMVGAFWQPQTVIIDIDVLSTLPQREYISGLAEVFKYALIMDELSFDRIESSVEQILARDSETMIALIADCCRCKAIVVEEDEQETSGRRAILNYGHTFGHAIEAVFGYGEYLHGEAIAIGMVSAARMARTLGMIDQTFCDRQQALFEAVGLPTECPAGRESEMLAAMKHDKKVASGKLNLILPTRIGEVISVPAPDDEALKVAMQR